MYFKTILEAIGNTPLVKMNFATPATVLAKLEYLNPGGSIKDRSALFMIEQAEQQGILKPGGTIIDASSGNHGIAVAMIGSLKGYKVIITVPEKTSTEKYQTMIAYGAEVIRCKKTDFLEHPDSYHSQAITLAAKTPNSFMPNQYYNLDNRRAHYTSLGTEVWRQTEGKITHFFAGAGSCGTISGAGQYLKEKNPAIKIYAVDSINSFKATNGNPKPYGIEGLGIDFDSPVVNYNVIDEIINISDEETFAMLKTLSHRYGLLGGPTTGGVALAVHKKLAELKEGDLAVFICGDSGRAYLSKNFYSQDEMIVPASKDAESDCHLKQDEPTTTL